MPGAYAHIAIVNDAQKRVDSVQLQSQTALTLGRYLKYVELGAVGPDYPYLAIKQAKWADNMHYLNTATVLRSGVAEVRALSAAERPRATAWLMGIAAHMTTDMTIHPVVELKVGPYQGNQGAHRQCEMHQDAFIFPRIMDVGETGLSEHLSTGIASCNAPDAPDQLHPTIKKVWCAMLSAAYPKDVAERAPDPSDWHRGFRGVLGAMAGANHLFPFARHTAAGLNLAYPNTTEVLSTYITDLATPEGKMDYPELFERARSNVLTVWAGIDAALRDGNSDFLRGLKDWNLDTGRSLLDQQLVFWKVKK
jgi:Zinc dependent phospholipase C